MDFILFYSYYKISLLNWLSNSFPPQEGLFLLIFHSSTTLVPLLANVLDSSLRTKKPKIKTTYLSSSQNQQYNLPEFVPIFPSFLCFNRKKLLLLRNNPSTYAPNPIPSSLLMSSNLLSPSTIIHFFLDHSPYSSCCMTSL